MPEPPKIVKKSTSTLIFDALSLPVPVRLSVCLPVRPSLIIMQREILCSGLGTLLKAFSLLACLPATYLAWARSQSTVAWLIELPSRAIAL